jgi:hypothetical protein
MASFTSSIRITPLKLLAIISLISITYIINIHRRLIYNYDSSENNEPIDLKQQQEQWKKHEMLLIKKYREKRNENYSSWIEKNARNDLRWKTKWNTKWNKTLITPDFLHRVMRSAPKLLPDADTNGTILDFAIAGFAKCGTTTMEANLGYIAPMPIADVCAGIHKVVLKSYKLWPLEFNIVNSTNSNGTITSTEVNKILRGTKCPRGVAGDMLDQISTYLPKTLLIVGIRHPIKFFESFWNMVVDNGHRNYLTATPYDFMRLNGTSARTFGCPKGQLICMHRSRLHLSLAQIGKTLLDDVERQLLAPDDEDGGEKLINHRTRNPIFLYELSQISEDYMWDELASTLKVPNIPHDIHKGNNIHRTPSEFRINICDAQYDDFRAAIMPHAYNMSTWFCDYFVPVAKDESRNDVIMANPDRVSEIVKGYRNDPCHRLIRMDNGTYVKAGQLDNQTIGI